MSEKIPQTRENHIRLVPAYHFVTFPILAANVVYALVQLVRGPGMGTILAFLVAAALVSLFLHARLFAIAVQDRVIRLEMRLRLGELLPPDLKPRIAELSTRQLVALRFASDAELAELVRKVLADRIEDGKTIKSMIKTWNPDYQRC